MVFTRLTVVSMEEAYCVMVKQGRHTFDAVLLLEKGVMKILLLFILMVEGEAGEDCVVNHIKNDKQLSIYNTKL